MHNSGETSQSGNWKYVYTWFLDMAVVNIGTAAQNIFRALKESLEK